MNDEVVIEDVLIVAETPRAVLVQAEDLPDGEMWIPQAVITEDSDVWRKGDEGKLVLAGWWARKAGLE